MDTSQDGPTLSVGGDGPMSINSDGVIIPFTLDLAAGRAPDIRPDGSVRFTADSMFPAREGQGGFVAGEITDDPIEWDKTVDGSKIAPSFKELFERLTARVAELERKVAELERQA